MNDTIQFLNAHAPDILRMLTLMEVQVAILALMVLGIERWLRTPSPKLRYALWMVVLAKSLSPPFLSISVSARLPFTQIEKSLMFVSTAGDAGALTHFSLATIILSLWFLATLVLGIIALQQYLSLRIRLRDSQLMDAKAVSSHEIPGFRWPPIWRTDRLPTPLVIGLFRPQIYVTAVAVESEPQTLHAILYHELAHVLRRDSWIVLLQTVTQILHPLNPFIWLMNVRLSRYREQLCDDFALRHTNVQPRVYGEILLRILEASTISRIAIQAGTCFFETDRGFKQRLKYLLTSKEVDMNRFTVKHKLLLAGMLLALLAFSWQCSNEKTPPPSPQTSIASKMPAAPADMPTVEYDIAPQVTKRVEPQYPELARKAGIEGRVLIKILIKENGQVGDAKVIECSAPNVGLEEAALTAAKQWVFSPAKKQAEPVAIWNTMTFNFKLK
ncbi:MAG: M56 family metallopeptidase [candidate division KSB1 bacterium]|nr:M56 family metallopeptidase [candidate division KSB1 bacterium]MDZ7301924.1 M56 family metallopeptidase [candidate division KSB1 bacterium]MDZ7314245.1 M56 family metallopeptidase [candidate division KSB1 bacterium]